MRGRRIESPPGDATRPTTDKVREAVFNALGSLDVIEGASVLDLFAGTGAMGIEALSRGAARCSFVENDRAAVAVLRRNIDALGLGGRADVVVSDARTGHHIERTEGVEDRLAHLVGGGSGGVPRRGVNASSPQFTRHHAHGGRLRA